MCNKRWVKSIHLLQNIKISIFNRMKNTKYIIGLWVGASLLYACGNKGSQAGGPPVTPPIPVTVEMAQKDIVTASISYPGNVVPLKETELRAEVSGYITQIMVEDGATVSAGQALYAIDQSRYQAALDQAKASLQIAQANLERVRRDLDRYEALAAKDAIARQVLDNAKTEWSNAQSQVNAAQSNVATAKLNLDRSVIRAPFAGMIGMSQVRVGALVSQGATLLNTLSSTQPIAVDFQVSESELPQILAMQGAAQQEGQIRLQVSGGLDYPFSGSIVAIDRAVNRSTGTITVRAKFDNPKGELRSGMSALIYLQRTSETPQLTIPFKAVTDQLGQSTLFVLGDSSRVEQRVVQLGQKVGDRVVVASGLQEGESFVVDGTINLRNGAVVAPQKATQEGQ
jgi:membrane fusion protein (multidrug efflux system)